MSKTFALEWHILQANPHFRDNFPKHVDNCKTCRDKITSILEHILEETQNETR